MIGSTGSIEKQTYVPVPAAQLEMLSEPEREKRFLEIRKDIAQYPPGTSVTYIFMRGNPGSEYAQKYIFFSEGGSAGLSNHNDNPKFFEGALIGPQTKKILKNRVLPEVSRSLLAKVRWAVQDVLQIKKQLPSMENTGVDIQALLAEMDAILSQALEKPVKNER